jgi:hypothetical protein
MLQLRQLVFHDTQGTVMAGYRALKAVKILENGGKPPFLGVRKPNQLAISRPASRGHHG